MARATEEQVKEIMDTTLTADEITPFLTSANVMLTGMVAGSGYTANELVELERWFAAHLAAIRDPQLMERAIGAGKEKFHGKSGMRLEHTPYGQQVLTLDYKGVFSEFQSRKGTASLSVIDYPIED